MISFMSAGGPPIARRDIAITAVFALLGVPAIGLTQKGHQGGLTGAELLMGLLILLAVVPVLWRRRAPLLAATGTLVGTAVHVAAYGTITRCGLLLPLLFVEGFAVAAWLGRREAIAGLLIVLGSGVVCLSADASAGWSGLTISVPVTLVVWIIGRVVRSRTAMVAALDKRNQELRSQREANARLEVETDRVRLAAELDDLLRIRLAELTQLAEVGVATSEDAGVALAHIEAKSRATLEQMRAVVGLLRNDEGDGTTPQPTLANLDALLLNRKGIEAELTVTGEPRALPAGLELSTYRIVEHLLGATDDAPGVHVQLDFRGDTLEVTVTGQARNRRRSEAAFDRARERLALHHGSLKSEVSSGRTRVTAALPVVVSR